MPKHQRKVIGCRDVPYCVLVQDALDEGYRKADKTLDDVEELSKRFAMTIT